MCPVPSTLYTTNFTVYLLSATLCATIKIWCPLFETLLAANFVESLPSALICTTNLYRACVQFLQHCTQQISPFIYFLQHCAQQISAGFFLLQHCALQTKSCNYLRCPTMSSKFHGVSTFCTLCAANLTWCLLFETLCAANFI